MYNTGIIGIININNNIRNINMINSLRNTNNNNVNVINIMNTLRIIITIHIINIVGITRSIDLYVTLLDCKVSSRIQKSSSMSPQGGLGRIREVAGDIAGTLDPDTDPSKTKGFGAPV